MSLDVYLVDAASANSRGSRIFIRENGANKEISREDWDRRFPGREPVSVSADETSEIYSRNITHNLASMAEKAGIYMPLWRPDEIGFTKASQLVAHLEAGLKMLLADPDEFKALNPENGWGNYDGLVAFVADYLAACKRHPNADVRVSR